MTMPGYILTKKRNYVITYVISVLVRLTVSQTFTQFIVRSDLADMSCTYPGSSTVTESVINCARLCSQDVTCAAFTGSDADKRCLLHTDIASGSCSAASGYVTYVQGVSSGSPQAVLTTQWLTTITTPSTSPAGQMFRLQEKTEGSGFAYGYIEVLESGDWFELCDFQYVNVDHAALCARIGYGSTAVPLYDVYGSANSTNLLQSLGCNHDYTLCSNTVLVPLSKCGRSGLYCSSGDMFQGIRLLDGATGDDGRVEIMLGDTWGTICGKDVGTDAARLLCLSLGYNDQQAFGMGAYTPGTGPIWWTGLDCTPSDTTLDTCTMSPDTSCDHISDFNLHCRY